MIVFDADKEAWVSIKKRNSERSPVERLVGPACEVCNDTGEKVDHKVEGAPGAVMVFCDCPAGDAVKEIYEEAEGLK